MRTNSEIVYKDFFNLDTNPKTLKEACLQYLEKQTSATQYLKTLPVAYEIYSKMFGEPKTHQEWAERFNKVGDINTILMENESN